MATDINPEYPQNTLQQQTQPGAVQSTTAIHTSTPKTTSHVYATSSHPRPNPSLRPTITTSTTLPITTLPEHSPDTLPSLPPPMNRLRPLLACPAQAVCTQQRLPSRRSFPRQPACSAGPNGR